MWDGWERACQGTRVDGAVLTGHRRSFNKKSTRNWGTQQAPGPTLGLEPHPEEFCAGTAFEFEEDQRAAVEALIREREGASFVLADLPVRLPDGWEVRALTPVNDRTAGTYIGNIPIDNRAAMARAAQGTDGASADYVRNIREKLNSVGIAEPDVVEFASRVSPPRHGGG